MRQHAASIVAGARRLLRRPESVIGAELPAEWYDEKFAATPSYHAAYPESPYYFLWSVIVDRIRGAGLRHVLDIGCGTGQLAAYLLDQGIDSYVGIDFSAKAIEYARRSAPRARFVVGDARASDIYTEEHDVLICTEVLEHITEDLAVVERFRLGTRCIFSVPSYTSAGHVRFFSDKSAVADRYGGYFDDLDVVEFPLASAAAGDNRIFLADGKRNAVLSHSPLIRDASP
jgi:SAM-dependent methyltransferase